LYRLRLNSIVFLRSFSGRWAVWVILGALAITGVWIFLARRPEKPAIVIEGNIKKVTFVRNMCFSSRVRWSAVVVVVLAVALLAFFERWR
jgi:hypothetical protein